MTSLLRSSRWKAVTPASAGWRYLSFWTLRLQGVVVQEPEPVETAIVLLSGCAYVEADGVGFELGPRASVFDELPWTLYLPRGSSYWIDGDAELAFATAPCERRLDPVLQPPGEVAVEVRGAANATRQINNMILPAFPAERLLVVEVLTPGGNWSSYPPHKHDEEKPPGEVVLEEIYYYRSPAPGAFGVQRLYSPRHGVDETWTVRDGDLVLVPHGYHPFAAAPGCDFYYLNALAGDIRSLAASDDPALAWVRSSWSGLSPDPRVPLVAT